MLNLDKDRYAPLSSNEKHEIARIGRRLEGQIEDQRLEILKRQLEVLSSSNKKDSCQAA
jgi:hypothetical protein